MYSQFHAVKERDLCRAKHSEAEGSRKLKTPAEEEKKLSGRCFPLLTVPYKTNDVAKTCTSFLSTLFRYPSLQDLKYRQQARASNQLLICLCEQQFNLFRNLPQFADVPSALLSPNPSFGHPPRLN